MRTQNFWTAALSWGSVALWLALPLAASSQPRFDLRSTVTRLPTTVLPSHVQLALDLDPALDTFKGEVTVQLQARQRVAEIEIHAKDLQAEVAQLQVGAHGQTRTRSLQVQVDAARSTWHLLPADGQPIAAGRYRLHIRYSGRYAAAAKGCTASITKSGVSPRACWPPSWRPWKRGACCRCLTSRCFAACLH